jgi:hypothetical protein
MASRGEFGAFGERVERKNNNMTGINQYANKEVKGAWALLTSQPKVTRVTLTSQPKAAQTNNTPENKTEKSTMQAGDLTLFSSHYYSFG